MAPLYKYVYYYYYYYHRNVADINMTFCAWYAYGNNFYRIVSWLPHNLWRYWKCDNFS